MPVYLSFLHVLLPAAIIITYSCILKKKGMTSTDSACCGDSNAVRIDMSRTNPDTMPTTNNFSRNNNSSTLPGNNTNNIPPVPEVPWFQQPSTNFQDTFSKNVPPPAYSN